MTDSNAKPFDDWRSREYLRVTEAAKIAGVSPSTLYNARKRGDLEFVKLCGCTLIPVKSFAKFTRNAEVWTPDNRADAALEARRERSRQIAA